MTQAEGRQPELCAALTAEGRPCQARPVAGAAHCWAHAPALAEKRTRARRQGGKAAHGLGEGPPPEVRLGAAQDVIRLLEVAAGDLLALQPSAQRARGLAYLCSAILRALEVSSLEERLAALEARSQWRTPYVS